MLLTMAPKKSKCEFVMTNPTAPQGWEPMTDPSQLNLTVSLAGGLQAMDRAEESLLLLKGMLNSLAM